MKSTIDDIDRAILECLREDARMSSSEIARRLNFISSRAVRNRLQNLRESGYIAIKAGAIPSRLGYGISADIAIEAEPGTIRSVAQSLIDLDDIIYVALSTGDTDVSATVVARTMGDLQEFITDKLHAIPGVRKTSTYVLTKVLKQSYDWPFPAELFENERE
jgi:Lrp/AsnC family transcriptional regulator for asnA, asnC and gidA